MLLKAIRVREISEQYTLAVSLLQYISTVGYEVVNVTQSLPPAQNVTVGWYCELTCPFNNATSSLEVYGPQQPCVYTLRITEVFRGNFTVSYAVLSISAKPYNLDCIGLVN